MKAVVNGARPHEHENMALPRVDLPAVAGRVVLRRGQDSAIQKRNG